jgi:hypothetical protein
VAQRGQAHQARDSEAFVFWFGAIAQLGERVLCKHEVVGSIPSGSTTLRLWLRVAQPSGAKAKCARRSSTSEDGQPSTRNRQSSAKHHFACRHPHQDSACGISDIVKRRSIRVWDLQSNLRVPNHNLQVISALVHRKMSGL